jgi:hypothetical protein
MTLEQEKISVAFQLAIKRGRAHSAGRTHGGELINAAPCIVRGVYRGVRGVYRGVRSVYRGEIYGS